MTVQDLIKKLKKLPKEAEVYLCKDWDQINEENHLTDLYRCNDVCSQTITIDGGMDFIDIPEVILCFDETKA